MNLTKKKFFEEELDRTIPELEAAATAFSNGDEAGAEHIFAKYIKKALKPECFFKIPRGTSSRYLEVAKNTLENKFTSVGVPIDFGVGNKVDWFANPTYNSYIEWEYQFNRHHEWDALACAYRTEGDEKYAECFARLAYSWITEAQQCPKPGEKNEPHWRTLECGIRIHGWCYPIHAFLKSPAVTDELWTLLFMSLWEQAEHLFEKNIGFNWLLTEKTGLLYLGLLYPFYKTAPRWAKRALDTLERLAHDLVYPDNVEVELSTGYHGVIVHDFLMVLDLYKAYDMPYPEKFADSARRLNYMYPQLATPGLYTPSLNDGQLADVVKACERGYRYFPDDELLRYFATKFAEGRRPDYNSLVMPYSGFFVMRTGFNPDDMWAFFEAAPFGADHPHEDKLLFLLYAYGADMLPNFGNFRYDKSKTRQYVLTTRSHNTGLVDGLPQNRRANWKRLSGDDVEKKSGIRARIGEDFEVGEGVYNEGYGPELLCATHKRKAIWFKKGYNGSLPFFVIIDDFSAEDGKEHFYESSWQLTDAPISVSGNKISATYKNGAVLNMISSVYPRIFVGQYEPEYMGWNRNPITEAREQIPAPLVSNAINAESGKIVTVLYPAPNSECPITDVKLAAGGFEIKFGDTAEFFPFDDERFATDEV